MDLVQYFGKAAGFIYVSETTEFYTVSCFVQVKSSFSCNHVVIPFWLVCALIYLSHSFKLKCISRIQCRRIGPWFMANTGKENQTAYQKKIAEKYKMFRMFKQRSVALSARDVVNAEQNTSFAFKFGLKASSCTK